MLRSGDLSLYTPLFFHLPVGLSHVQGCPHSCIVLPASSSSRKYSQSICSSISSMSFKYRSMYVCSTWSGLACDASSLFGHFNASSLRQNQFSAACFISSAFPDSLIYFLMRMAIANVSHCVAACPVRPHAWHLIYGSSFVDDVGCCALDVALELVVSLVSADPYPCGTLGSLDYGVVCIPA